MKYFFKKLLFILSVVILAFSTVFIWLKTPSGQGFVKNKISAIISSSLTLDSRIEEFSFSLPLTFKIKKLAILGKEHEDIIFDDILISIHPSLFLFWKTSIEEIKINKLQINKLPVIASSSNDSTLSDKKYINFFPNIRLEKLIISHIITSDNLLPGLQLKNISLKSSAFYSSLDGDISYHIGLLAEKISTNNTEILSFSTLNSTGKYSISKQNLAIKSFKINSEELSISAGGQVDLLNDKVNLDADYKSSIIKNLFPALLSEQSNTGNIKIKGSLNQLNFISKGAFKFKLQNDNIYNFPQLNYSATGNYDISTNQLFILPEIKQADFMASGQVTMSNKFVSVQNFTATSQHNESHFRKYINLTYGIENNSLDGEIDIDSNDLSLIKNYFPWLTGGKASFKTKLSSNSGKKQVATIEGSLNNIYTKWANIENLALNINCPDLYNLYFSDSVILANKILSNDVLIDTANFSFNSQDKHNIITKMFLKDGLNTFDVSGILAKGEVISYDFTDLEIMLNKYKINLNKNRKNHLKYTAKQNILDIDFAANTDVGLLEVSLISNNSNLQGKILLDKISSVFFRNLLPLKLKNSLLSCDLNFKGPLDDVSVNGSLDLEKVALSGQSYNFKSTLKDASNKGLLINSIFADAKNDKQIAVLSNIPLKLNFKDYVFEILPDEKWSHNITIDSKNSLLSLLRIPGHTIEGDLTGKMQIAGSYNSPTFFGSLLLKSGKYSYGRYGLNLYDIAGDISASNQQIQLNNIQCFDIFKNKASGNGFINLGKKMEYYLAAHGDNFNLINMPYLYSHIGGDFYIKGNELTGAAYGNVTFDKTSINIPENIGNEIPQINIVKSLNQQDSLSTKNKKYKLNLDIKASTKNNIDVKGYGIDTELNGMLEIKGDVHTPLVYGELKTNNGRFDKYGRTLQIQKGKLAFKGEIPPSPYISVIAVQKSPNYEVRLVLEGSIDNPQLDIQTNPATYSKQEAISLLLFGKPISEISSSETLKIFTIIGGESNVGSKLPIKDISVRTAKRTDPETGQETDETRIGYGHYLNQNIYVDIENPSGQFAPKGRISMRISPLVTIEATVDDESNNSAGISFQYDY